MDATKIRLSPKEKELLQNAGWILTKNEIVKKAKLLLEGVMEEQLSFLRSGGLSYRKEIISVSPKISRGENYKGLPWLILDHPRLFSKQNAFAIRTFFWWGNFFSVTMHLAGSYKGKIETSVAAAYERLKEEDIYCSVNDDPWQHHFEKDNYRKVAEWNRKDFDLFIKEKEFIKLSKKISLDQWDHAPAMLINCFKLFLEIIDNA